MRWRLNTARSDGNAVGSVFSSDADNERLRLTAGMAMRAGADCGSRSNCFRLNTGEGSVLGAGNGANGADGVSASRPAGLCSNCFKFNWIEEEEEEEEEEEGERGREEDEKGGYR